MPFQKRNYTNSLSAINSPTGYTEDQLREFAEREARNELIDPNASLNELIAYNERKRQEREANLAKGMAEYIKDPRYITRSLEAFKKANPYATLVDFTKFINSDTILRAYYTGTDAYRNLNDSQIYSDYRQFFPEQENIFNTLRKGSLEEQEDTNWFAKQAIDLGKGAEKVVRGIVSPFIYADKQIEAVDDLNKFPKEEITALKSKQMQAYKLTQELNNLKASNWFSMTDADRNRTVQKIDSIQKALESLNPTEREQQLIDSGVVYVVSCLTTLTISHILSVASYSTRKWIWSLSFSIAMISHSLDLHILKIFCFTSSAILSLSKCLRYFVTKTMCAFRLYLRLL